MSILDTWILSYALASSGTLKALSALRVLRLARLVRVIRIMRAFKELWLLVQGLINAFRSLFWVLLLLAVVIYCVAIFITISVGQRCESDPYVAVGDVIWTRPMYPDCAEYFGNVPASMYTLFQVLTLDRWSSLVDINFDGKSSEAVGKIQKKKQDVAFDGKNLEVIKESWKMQAAAYEFQSPEPEGSEGLNRPRAPKMDREQRTAGDAPS